MSSSPCDVFFFEAFQEEEAALRRYLPAGVRAAFSWKTIQEYQAPAPPAHFISIRTQSALPHDWARDLAGILTRSTGFDHLTAYRAATGVPVPCGFLPLYCNRAVAEQALLLWLALLRKLPQQLAHLHTFHRDGITGGECAGKTLTVVGVGNIGHEIIKIGTGLGMRVLGVDLVERHADVQYVTPAAGIAAADIIVCAMNLTATNHHYFCGHVLQAARRGVLFINIARGECSPATDLLRLLDEGQLGGVGLDVYHHEKELALALRTNTASNDAEVCATLALARHPRALLTPHNAFNTHEAVARKSEQSMQQVQQFLATGVFLWPLPA
ncbi:MAG: hydroxyacid dehydrogenase [bacterium]|nr:hydroxyacid dehydrogenase [bacterium]